jgi:hypothetical protein
MKLGVPRRVRDVAMSEIVLNDSRVVTVLRESVAARVPQHVRMNGEWQPRLDASARNHLPNVRVGHWSATFGDEYVWRARIVSLQAAKRSELWASDRMNARASVLRTRDVQRARLHVELIPTQRDELRDTQPVAIGDKDQRSVAMTVPAGPARCVIDAFDFIWRQIFASA